MLQPEGGQGTQQGLPAGRDNPEGVPQDRLIDHPVEGRQLADPAVQAQLADAIAEAIADQLAEL